MMNNTNKKLLLMSLFAIFLSSCSGNNSDLSKYINGVKARPGTPIEPIPKFSPLPIFRFPENDTRRSPFKLAQQKKEDDSAPDQTRPKQPLEAYPLDALKFVGVLTENNHVWALIKTPDKKVTSVKVGNFIGQNYGQIISIKGNQIKLEESLKEAGKWVKHDTTVHLYQGKK